MHTDGYVDYAYFADTGGNIYRLDLASLETWVRRQVELYPTDPGTHENSARLALEHPPVALPVVLSRD